MWAAPPKGTPFKGHPLAYGLDTFYLFQEGSGTSVADLAGNHTLTLDLTALSWVPNSLFANTYAINSAATTSTTARGTPANTFNFGSFSWTMEFWITNAGSDTYGSIYTINNASAVFSHNSGAGYFISYFGAGGDHQNNTLLQHGVMYHVVLTYNIVGQVFTHWINGKPDGSTSFTISNIGTDPNCMFNDTTSETFIGSMHLFRIWKSRILNAYEINQLYRNPLGMFESPRLWRNRAGAAATGWGPRIAGLRSRRVR